MRTVTTTPGGRFRCFPFVAATALMAAALADPLVECTADSGFFGGGFSDTNHLGVLPALAAAVLIISLLVLLRCCDVARRAQRGAPAASLAEFARALAPDRPAQLLPAIFALQIAALFGIESFEQLATTTGLPHGLTWLGGPVVFSLGVHALIGTLCTFALTTLLRCVLQTAALFIDEVVHAFTLTDGDAAAAIIVLRVSRIAANLAAPFARHIGGRAPPSCLFVNA